MTDKAPLTRFRGVSDARAAKLETLGLVHPSDVFLDAPRDYEDWSVVTSGMALTDGVTAVVIGRLTAPPSVSFRGRLSVIRAVVRVDGVALRLVWFNQPWLKTTLKVESDYAFRGLVERRGLAWSMASPQIRPAHEPAAPLVPVYRLTKGITQTMRRTLVRAVMADEALWPKEFLPHALRQRRVLCERAFAFQNIHYPSDREALAWARTRLIYEELFLLKLALSRLAEKASLDTKAPSLVLNDEAQTTLAAWIDRLPFALTGAQTRAIDAIVAALKRSTPMHRLLQGDVGCGKTVVAAAAIVATVAGGGQAMLLAPTTVLAQQHETTLRRWLEPMGMTVALLTGSTRAVERRTIHAGVADGSIDVVVGTHAVLDPSLNFRALALAITDEQHRFGVAQRQALLGKADGVRPHLLVMSATPIPRTLALIVYGDLDSDRIDEMPPGRPVVETYTARPSDQARIDRLIGSRVARGEQVFIVCPLIERTDDSDLEAATSVCARLAAALPAVRVQLLHGAMKTRDKDRVMSAFVRGDIDVLVSTTVIEVGIDLPNATLMIVQNAERFGLAQLHQLRGRVGRGDKKGLCILCSASDDPTAKERLRAVCTHRDGFQLAEIDLALRGPGDFFGVRQHGLPELRLADLYRDRAIIDAVSQDVSELLAADPTLAQSDHRHLLAAIGERFGDDFMSMVL